MIKTRHFLLGLISFLVFTTSFSFADVDPIKLTMSTNAGQVKLGDEITITIKAQYVSFPSNTVFIFNESNSYKIKVVLPDGFKQTGGTYHEYVGGVLSPSNREKMYTIIGKFESSSSANKFILLRGASNAHDKSEFKMAGSLTYQMNEQYAGLDSTARSNSTLAVTDFGFVPYMFIANLRGGDANEARVVEVLNSSGVWTYRYDSSDNTSADNGITVIVDTYASRNYRYKLSADFLTPEMFGAKGDSSANDSPAFQAAISFLSNGGTLALRAGGKYRVSTITSTKKSITIRGNGAKLIQVSNNGVFDFNGDFEWTDDVTDISGRTITTSGSHSGSARGDLLKIVSDDQLAFGQSGTKQGEFLSIKDPVSATSFEVSGNIRDSYTTNVRVGKLNKVTYQFYDLVFDTEGTSSGSWNAHYIKVRNSISPVYSNISSIKGFAALIKNQSNYGARADRINAMNLENTPSKSRYGYGFEDKNGAGTKLSNSNFINVRHGYTTNCDVLSTVRQDLELYGATADAIIENCTSIGASNSGFDTHEEGYNINFISCISKGSFQGLSAVGAGFTTRAVNVTFTNCYDYGSRYGFRIEGENPALGNTTLINCTAANSQSQSILIQSGVSIKGGSFSASNTYSAVRIENSIGVDFQDVFVKTKNGSATNNYLIDVLADAQITFRNLTLDGTDMSKVGTMGVNRFVHLTTANYLFKGTGLYCLGTSTNGLDFIVKSESGGKMQVSDASAGSGVSRNNGGGWYPNMRLTDGLALSGYPVRYIGEEIFDNTNGVTYKALGTTTSSYVGTIKASGTLNFSSKATGTYEDLTITVSGAEVGDIVTVGGPVPAAGTTFTGFVATSGIATVRFSNNSGSTIDPASATFKVLVTK